ncbi:MAG: metallophosphoesterase [Actinobacteria bacterium]|nr:metallophosphoesterase [Actinomycetota bacterium]MCA1807154.1 metallophosphoesterase [Actinomycetota bacterium]
MSKLWVLGDPHLSAENEWQAAASRKVIDWVESHPYNKEGNVTLLAGDIIDKYHSAPPTHHLVMKFLMAFKTQVIIVVGNHDIEKTAANSNGQSVAYEYIKEMGDHFTMLEYPSTFKVFDLECIALPFYKAPVHSLVDLRGKDPLRKYGIDNEKAYDLCIAHHFLYEERRTNIPEEVTLDVWSLLPNTKLILSGHVHVADSLPNNYLGSLYAKKIDEQGERYTWVYDSVTRKWLREVMPAMCSLISVKYGEALPKPKGDALPVYTITHCPSPDKARAFYGNDVFIRKVVSSWEHIRTNQDFASIDSERYSSEGLISKEDLMYKFEQMVLDDASEWKKVDVSRDTLIEAVNFIKKASLETKEDANVLTN